MAHPDEHSDTASQVAYRERLFVPLRWWVQGTMLVASFWLAFAVALPPLAAGLIAGAVAGLMVLLFWSYGGTRIEVAGGELRAGRAHIATVLLGRASALDAEGTRRLAGVDADARAFLLLRPYVRRAVRVDLHDPADPTPYWLLSSRHPERLADTLTALGPPQDGGPHPDDARG